jgi:riboflavin kinase/FMN adenylyltransferase
MNKELRISGRVVHGDHYGKILGFPTANIDRRAYSRRKMSVKLGVWAGMAILNFESSIFKSYKAAIVMGPTDKNGLPKIEAHLIGFKGNLYGKKMQLVLTKYIRPFKKYRNEEDLKRQIKKDIKNIRKV